MINYKDLRLDIEILLYGEDQKIINQNIIEVFYIFINYVSIYLYYFNFLFNI